MRRSVFLKLLAAFFVVIATATVALNLVIQRTWVDSLRREIERSMVAKTRLFAYRVETDHTRPLQQLVNEEAAAANARATVIDPSGKVLADSAAEEAKMENHAARPEFMAALHGATGSSTRLSHTVGIEFLYVAVPIPGGAVRLAYPLASIQQTTAKVRQSLLLASAAALGFASLLAAFLAHRVSQRLTRIVAFAQRVTAGDLNARIAEASSDELATVTAALDGTARKLQISFAALQDSHDEMETLLNSMEEAVIAVNSSGEVLWANGRMRALAPSAAQGSPVIESVRDPSFLAALEGALQRKQVSRARMTSFVRGRTFEMTAAPMGTGGAVVVLHDVTELERVEKTRRDFIANVSHELRTPLTSIQGYAETVLESLAADGANASSREFLEVILKNAARMTRLTEDLLVLAKVESGEQRYNLVAVSSDELLEEAVRSARQQASAAGVELAAENAIAEPVLADRDAMHQVFANLIDNAIKYAGGGKRIVVGAQQRGQMVEFFVRDFGPGIGSQHHARLFERFYRVDKARSREAGGTGLGLAIVKHIVQVHAGQVRVESRLGHGATFYFSLPRASAAGATLAGRSDAPSVSA